MRPPTVVISVCTHRSHINTCVCLSVCLSFYAEAAEEEARCAASVTGHKRTRDATDAHTAAGQDNYFPLPECTVQFHSQHLSDLIL